MQVKIEFDTETFPSGSKIEVLIGDPVRVRATRKIGGKLYGREAVLWPEASDPRRVLELLARAARNGVRG